MQEHIDPSAETHQAGKVDGTLVSAAELSDSRAQAVLAVLDDFALNPTSAEGTMGGVARIIAQRVRDLQPELQHMTNQTAIRTLNSLHRMDYYWHGSEPQVVSSIQAFIDALEERVYGAKGINPESSVKHIGGEEAKTGAIPGVAVVEWQGSPIYTYLTGAEADSYRTDSRPRVAFYRNSHNVWLAEIGREMAPVSDEGVTFGRESFPDLKQKDEAMSKEISRSHIFVRVGGNGMLEIHDTSMNGTTVETRSYPAPPAEMPLEQERPKGRLAAIRERLKGVE